jgi:hypothetical protein
VVALESGAIVVDDGTGRGRVVLRGEATAYLPLIEPEDAVNATGQVVLSDGRAEVSVTDPGGLLRVGDLGEPIPVGQAEAESDPAPVGAVDPIQPGPGRSETAAGIGALRAPAEGPGSAGIALAAFEGPVGLGSPGWPSRRSYPSAWPRCVDTGAGAAWPRVSPVGPQPCRPGSDERHMSEGRRAPGRSTEHRPASA